MPHPAMLTGQQIVNLDQHVDPWWMKGSAPERYLAKR
jgi:hypothetical protein